MPFANGYRGVAGGSVQTAYTDQPGQAYEGQLAFASDLNNCDALFIAETDGIAAGLGVKVAELEDTISLQRPNQAASLPAATDDETDFAGILAFDESMQTDENGVPGYAKGRVGRFLKPGRAGGRIYVKAQEIVAIGDPVEWVVKAGTDPILPVGGFTSQVHDGTSTNPLTVTLANARWVTPAAAGEMAILELF